MNAQHTRVLAAVSSLIAALLLATPVLGGEITDENERIEKIVIRVNNEPERDPELSVGGESVTVYEGDLVTFRIALNDDQTRPNFDRIARMKDVYKTARFRFVSITSSFGQTCNEPNATEPPDTSLECQVTLDEQGNTAVRITLRAIDVGGEATDPQGCIETTNVVNSVHPSGGDQAQVTICPAELRPPGASTPPPDAGPTSPSPTAAGGGLPNTTTGASGTVGQLVFLPALLSLLGMGALIALLHRRSRPTD